MTQMLYLSAADDTAEPRENRVFAWARRHSFPLLVLLPTLLVAFYLLAFASPQYKSEAQFVVRGLDAPSPSPGGFGQFLGMVPSLAQGQQEAQSIREYLRSHDAVDALRGRGIDLVAMYRRAGTDPFSALWSAQPKAETLLDYYRDHVDVIYDPDDNITRLSVRAFRPEDALRISRALLQLGEARVNAYNVRLFEASVKTADTEAAAAEAGLAEAETRVDTFRESQRDIDPAATGVGKQHALDSQQADLDQQQALLSDMRAHLSASSPQVRAMQTRVASLAAALAASRNRLTGDPSAVAGRLGTFEDLQLRRELAAKRFEAAHTRLEEERARAAKGRLFIIAVVEPNLPEKPVLPKPLWTSLLVLIGLCIAYGIGWMLLAGVREHQA